MFLGHAQSQAHAHAQLLQVGDGTPDKNKGSVNVVLELAASSQHPNPNPTATLLSTSTIITGTGNSADNSDSSESSSALLLKLDVAAASMDACGSTNGGVRPTGMPMPMPMPMSPTSVADVVAVQSSFGQASGSSALVSRKQLQLIRPSLKSSCFKKSDDDPSTGTTMIVDTDTDDNDNCHHDCDVGKGDDDAAAATVHTFAKKEAHAQGTAGADADAGDNNNNETKVVTVTSGQGVGVRAMPMTTTMTTEGMPHDPDPDPLLVSDSSSPAPVTATTPTGMDMTAPATAATRRSNKGRRPIPCDGTIRAVRTNGGGADVTTGDGAGAGTIPSDNRMHDMHDVRALLEHNQWLALDQLILKTPTHLEAALLMTIHTQDNDNNHNRATISPSPSISLPSLLLHTMCWKAPPSLALKLLRIIAGAVRSPRDRDSPDDSETDNPVALLRHLATAVDADGNTPLHLCAANTCCTTTGTGTGTYGIPQQQQQQQHMEQGQALTSTLPHNRQRQQIQVQQRQRHLQLQLVLELQVLHALLQLDPDACVRQNQQGDTPLHLLLIHGPATMVQSVGIVLSHEQGRQALLLHDAAGQTPLHVAIAHSAPLVVLDALMDAALALTQIEHDEALQTKKMKQGEEVIEDLNQDNTKDESTTISSESSSAHDGVTVDAVQLLLQKMTDHEGLTLMHYVAAFCHHTPLMFVQRLYQLWPESVRLQSNAGDTPLHICISNLTKVKRDNSHSSADSENESDVNIKVTSYSLLQREIVSILLSSGSGSPKAKEEGNRNACGTNHRNKKHRHHHKHGNNHALLIQNNHSNGKLNPLHCCALLVNVLPPAFTQQLVTFGDTSNVNHISEQAAVQVDKYGATPLHLAVAQPQCDGGFANVVALANGGDSGRQHQHHCPAASMQDRLGRTPLHVAAQNKDASFELIHFLTQLNPQAATVAAHKGHLPLHLAAQQTSCDADMVRALIAAYPAAASHTTHHSLNTPLHHAAKYGASIEAIQVLVQAYPQALVEPNFHGNTPLHLHCSASALPSASAIRTGTAVNKKEAASTTSQQHNSVLSCLIQSNPSASTIKNKHGDKPLQSLHAHATGVVDAAAAAAGDG
jgi:ankyrin repeat protein